MSDANIQRLLQAALEHHQGGRLAEAQLAYARVLAADPTHADAMHLLGVIRIQQGQPAAGAGMIRQALARSPGHPRYLQNLGVALQAMGDLDGAIEALRYAIRGAPDSGDLHYNLANVLRDRGATDEAVAAYRRVLELQPTRADAHNNLGNVLVAKKDFVGAQECFKRAIALVPGESSFYNNLGVALSGTGDVNGAIECYQRSVDLMPAQAETHARMGELLHDASRFDEAAAAFGAAVKLDASNSDVRRSLGVVQRKSGRAGEAVENYHAALSLSPENAEAHCNLAFALMDLGKYDSAIASCRRSIAINPQYAEAYNALGMALRASGDLDGMLEAIERSIELAPRLAEAHNNRGNVLKDTGRLDEAIEAYRGALSIREEFHQARSNLIFAMQHRSPADATALADEQAEFERVHVKPFEAHHRPFTNNRDPNRRLRIGYVSADFRRHPVGRFMLPLLRAHDRRAVSVHCYSSARGPDDMTRVIRSLADAWHEIAGLSDEKAAELIRNEGIDILIDLGMHTADSRLSLFARRPAPVRISYLGYAGRSGVGAVDYYLSDAFLENATAETDTASEEPLLTSGTYWCYEQSLATPPVNELPALAAGRVSFGCLNNFSKVNADALSLWAELLNRVPGSTLVLHAAEGRHRDRARRVFVDKGISADRVTFVGRTTSEDYFAAYHAIDLALDPFPFAGGTTTCDALWMGVPVVTLAGHTPLSRAGVSILNNAGYPEFIAADRERYLATAEKWATDLVALSEVRTTMRPRLERSRLMDKVGCARGLDSAYRTAWAAWCQSGK